MGKGFEQLLCYYERVVKIVWLLLLLKGKTQFGKKTKQPEEEKAPMPPFLSKNAVVSEQLMTVRLVSYGALATLATIAAQNHWQRCAE